MITILVVSLYGGKYGFLENSALKMQDGMFKLRGANDTPPAEIIIVGIDDRSVNQIGRWPWHRDVLAQLISDISKGSPKIIGLDIFLPEEIEEDTSGRTKILADEIFAARNVILPIYFSFSEVGIASSRTPDPIMKSSIGGGKAQNIIETSLISARQIYYPSQPLTNASYGFGHINMDYDADGLIRREPLLMNYEGHLYPSFGLQLAIRYLKIETNKIRPKEDDDLLVENITIPTDSHQRMILNYLGPDFSFKRMSAMEVLNGEMDSKIFNQKIVLVGLTASGSKTRDKIPAFGEINEVERIASVTENIIHHSFLKQLSGFWHLLILIFIGMFCALVLPNISLTYRIVILLVFLFVVFNLSYILFSSLGILTNPIYPLVELLFFLIAAPTIKPKVMQREGIAGESAEPKSDVVEASIQKSLSEESQREEAIHKTEETKVEVSTRILVKEQTREKQGIIPMGVSRLDGPEENKSKEIHTEKKDTNYPLPSPPGSSEEKTMAFSKTSTPPSPLETSSHTPFPGSSPPAAQFGRYRIVRLLGKGGMGTVYQGIDPVLDRSVALKTIRLDYALSPAEISELKERLIREAKAAGKLSHPNIVTIYDVGEEGGLHYIAMEYLSGYTLEEFIQKKGELNYRIVAGIIMQTCEALSYAHQHSIVHRDIKPANIMLLDDFHVKVMDFGIARLETASLTQSNVAMGTPHYISPEQIEGKPADKRSDIFSLGVVIYEILTRQKPFLGENISSLMYRILNQEPLPPSSVNEKTPLVFDRIVAKCIAKKPEERYQEAEEISKAMKEFISSFVVTRSIRI